MRFCSALGGATTQKTKACRYASQRLLHIGLMCRMQALKRAPVHSLGLATITIQYARFPSQPLADFLGFAARAIIGLFALGAIGQVVAMAAGISERISISKLTEEKLGDVCASLNGNRPNGIPPCMMNPEKMAEQIRALNEFHRQSSPANGPASGA